MSGNTNADAARSDAGAERCRDAMKRALERTSGDVDKALKLASAEMDSDPLMLSYVMRFYLEGVLRDRPDLNGDPALVDEAMRRLRVSTEAKVVSRSSRLRLKRKDA